MGEKRRRPALVVRTGFLLTVLGVACYMLASRELPWAASSGGGGGGRPAARSLAEYDVEAATPVYGLIRKRGPLGSLAMMGEGRRREALVFPGPWREARLRGVKKPPPARWCALMYNDKYRLIYVKCPKTAGTTLVTYFTDCSQPDAADRCLRLLDYTNATLVRHLLDSWDDYFVFSFSRNVLRRAISQYQYLTTFIRQDEGCPRVDWGEYCRDPFLLGDICHDRATKPCCTQSAEHQYVHASPQVNCFTTRRGASALDWLGRVESFEEDFRELVRQLNARQGVPQLPTDVLPQRANFNASPCKGGGRSGGDAAAAAAEGGDEGGGAGGTARRQLRWGWAVRNDTENPCDKNDFFRGRHAHCFPAIMSFYGADMRMLRSGGKRGA